MAENTGLSQTAIVRIWRAFAERTSASKLLGCHPTRRRSAPRSPQVAKSLTRDVKLAHGSCFALLAFGRHFVLLLKVTGAFSSS